MATTYTLIQAQNLTSSQTSVTFSAIPSTYTDLCLKMSIRSDRSAYYDVVKIQLSGDSGSNYSMTELYGGGTAGSQWSARRSNTTSIDQQWFQGASSTSNTFTSIDLYLPSYTASQNKPFSTSWATEDNSAGNARVGADAMLWRNTSAVSSILLTPNTGPNFVSGSSFYLYGIKNS